MADGLNNIKNYYQYSTDSLNKYENQNDTENVSLFDTENNLQKSVSEEQETEETQFQETDKEEQLKSLKEQLQNVEDKQGLIGSAWNKIKSATGIGSSSEKCEQAIEDFENGKITYEEAAQKISEFETKQTSSLNLISNIATGLATAAVVGSAIATGGLSLGVVALGAGVGAATKAGLKFADRATNEVKDDALDGKQIAKDALSGAVDGAVTVTTMGVGTAAVTSKTVAEQTLKQTIIEGAKGGAKAGMLTGATTGATEYALEAGFEEDVDFNLKDLAKNTATNAAAGAIFGGIAGGVSSGVQYSKVSSSAKTSANAAESAAVEETVEEAATPNVDMDNTVASAADSKDDVIILSEKSLTKHAEELNQTFEKNIDEATEQIKNQFGDNESVVAVTGRAKSTNSTTNKLASKYEKNKLTQITDKDCFDAIGDGYGTRVQMKSLSESQARNIVEKSLKDTNISYDDFVKYVSGSSSGMDDDVVASLKELSPGIINELKEAQTQEVFESLTDGIKKGTVNITELNNYGDEVSSYFTDRQLQEIAKVYNEKTGKKLKILTKIDDSFGQGKTVDADNNLTDNSTVWIKKGSEKDSGYTSTQMNVKHSFKDGTIGNGELQIRGTEVNSFADVEHIPYDIRKDKITEFDTKYSDVYSTIKSMSSESYSQYNSYLSDVYKHLRLKEMGIITPEPVLSGNFLTEAGDIISDEAMKKLTVQGLQVYSH